MFGPGDLEPLDLDILTEGSIDVAVIVVICHVNEVAAQIQIAWALSPGNQSKDTARGVWRAYRTDIWDDVRLKKVRVHVYNKR